MWGAYIQDIYNVTTVSKQCITHKAIAALLSYIIFPKLKLHASNKYIISSPITGSYLLYAYRNTKKQFTYLKILIYFHRKHFYEPTRF